MQKWEYAMRVAYVGPQGLHKQIGVSAIWTQPIDPSKSKETTWDVIQRMGSEGWELVSTFTVATYRSDSSGATDDVVFMFKRPIN